MRTISIVFCLLLASAALAANGGDLKTGTVRKPGHDATMPAYIGNPSDTRVTELRERFGASYVRLDDQIPSQAIIVAPKRGRISNMKIDDGNVENAARGFLEASGSVPAGCDLNLISKKLAMNREWFVNFRKNIAGIPVEDAGLNLAISPGGKVNLLWGNFADLPSQLGTFSIGSDMASQISERGLEGSVTRRQNLGKSYLPLYFNGQTEYHPVYKFRLETMEPFAQWEVYVDAQNGQILERVDRVYYDEISGNVTGSIQPSTPYDEWVDRNLFAIDLNFFNYDPATTDSVGHYSINTSNSDPIDVTAQLRGPYLQVMNTAGPDAEIDTTIDPPAVYNIYWDDSNSTPPERDGWYGANTVHHWIRQLDTTLTVMDFPMNCNVNVAGSCNAYWSGWDETINFYRAGGGCPNIAQIADVIFHEYGHGITDLMTRPSGPNGAMHEGFSDYLACTITNQPHVGLGFFGPGTFLRNLDNHNRWPDDTTGESHNDGLIISGALWHTRAALSPYPMGYADSLWHFARYALTQDFENYFWAYVALDDNDGDISNGTPHAYDIFHAFGDLHGIGPGTVASVSANHVDDTEDTTRTFPVSAAISTIFAPRADSILLYYDNGSGFTPHQMTLSDTVWQATIPAQRNNTRVNYYVLAVDQGGFRGTAPDSAPSTYYSFLVGPDVIPPAVNLVEAPNNTVNLSGPYGPFIVNAQDIDGINDSGGSLHYFINSESENSVPLVPTGNPGEYAADSVFLGHQLLTGDTVHYYFTVQDMAHNPNTARLPATGSYSFQTVTSEIFEDFESHGMDRWTADPGWGIRNGGHNSLHSVWFSYPHYPDNADASITMNFDYDLSPYSRASLTLYNLRVMAQGDTCFIELTNTGGISWIRIAAFSDTLAPMFHYAVFDITPYLLHFSHHYKVRFHFVSDGSINSIGAMFDDIGWSVDAATDISEPVAELPRQMALSQNYPNPFNPETKILFALASKSNVRLEVFDIMGRLVKTLVNKEMVAGSYDVTWAGVDDKNNPVASGVYFYRLVTDQGVRQAKMTLLR